MGDLLVLYFCGCYLMYFFACLFIFILFYHLVLTFKVCFLGGGRKGRGYKRGIGEVIGIGMPDVKSTRIQ